MKLENEELLEAMADLAEAEEALAEAKVLGGNLLLLRCEENAQFLRQVVAALQERRPTGLVKCFRWKKSTKRKALTT